MFCNAAGSGTGLLHKGFDLRAQWDRLTAKFVNNPEAPQPWAYLQSFSNTHGPAELLDAVLAEVTGLPGVRGLCLGTRPDCLDPAKLDLLAAVPLPVRLEMGLQSSNDRTLILINRGHDAACFARAAIDAAALGLTVCAHVIAGLPGENLSDFLATVDFLAALPVWGVKFHNLFVARGSRLERIWRAGEYRPIERAAYVAWMARAIPRLRADMVVERINADPAPGELAAPDWASDKSGVIRDIRKALDALGTWQGRERDAPDRMPEW